MGKSYDIQLARTGPRPLGSFCPEAFSLKLFRALILVLCSIMLTAVSAAQSWQPLTNQPSFGAGNQLLLTDGTILVHDWQTSNWWKFTPDINGSYVNGTWSQAAGMPSNYGPLWYASAVLPDGRVVVQGGEYNLNDNNGNGVWTNLGAIYDPVADTWTALPAPPGWNNIGDAQCVVMPNGQLIMANPFDERMAVFDPVSLTWSSPLNNGKTDRFDEEGWTLLPDGTLITVD